MEWSSGLGHSPTTPTNAAADHPHGPQSCGVHLVAYLVGVIFFRASLAVILGGKRWRRECWLPLPHSLLGQAPEGRGDWPGARGEESGVRG